MLVGVPKEIKNHEYRVGLMPGSVRELTAAGHRVIVEVGAGTGAGYDDEQYMAVGAEMVSTAGDVFSRADLVIKVKEPQLSECRQLRKGQTLFTFLHLAPDPDQTQALIDSGVTAIAYETVTDDNRMLPLLTPMSEVAGRMSVQVGAHYLEQSGGGTGVLLGGVPGVAPGRVTIIGGGVAGTNAAKMAVGLGANVTVLEKSPARMRELNDLFGASADVIYATAETLEEAVLAADLVVGAVLIPGAAAPKLVTRELVAGMRRGTVMVDIAIDQGGCFETSRPTSHDDPTYIEEGVVHYCVTNMPGAVPKTSTQALNNATLPYVLSLANNGAERAMSGNVHLAAGLNVHQGRLMHPAVKKALDGIVEERAQ